ncbi:hypothetical protein COV17_01130 [Candidatus Woesearchaeota archaeon CG10_big_fil_rev_8_21_14_0_10_36_11]|nr:MAG: hypothetical protein COV17_01130 [Candidatus Woesearchaeota archaeon CG10_big_fil_rev_8_21_14_0_10_36_11]
MEHREIKTKLQQYQSKIIKILSEDDWKHFRKYLLIKNKYLSNSINQEFEKVFCDFYILNGPMGLNEEQKREYFRLLMSKETSLRNILEKLYEIPGWKNSHKLFLSFGTKLLHTINENLPIYDRNIAFILELANPINFDSIDEKIKNRIEIYEQLKEKFDSLLKDLEIQDIINNLKEELHDSQISDTKILDSLLWAFYSSIKN